jgi:regulator of sirC expression with transglutaminase-like and TPR domain
MTNPAQMPASVPTPLAYFAALVAADDGFPLTEAAASLAQDSNPTLDLQAVLGELDQLAERLRRRLPADAAAVPRLRALNRFFFEELGFAGNINDYYDPANSYLDQVLMRRRGIPISLAVVYMELAQQIGLRASGIAFPGHFLVRVRLQGAALTQGNAGVNGGDVVMDPFVGRSLSREELAHRLADFRSRLPYEALEIDLPLAHALRAASPRDIVGRMLRNLQEIHRSRGDEAGLALVNERLRLLEPAGPA